jgi:hypothetical protein
MATGPNYYDIKVAEQAHADATKALQNTVTDYAYLQAALTRQAIEKTLTKPEIELLYTKNNGLTVNNVPADRQQAVQTELKKITAANTEYARLQKAIDTSQTAVKSTQLNLNSAINGVRITQGKSGPDLSPAIDPNAKQAPYTVRPPGTTLGVTHNTLTGTRQTTTGRTTNTLTGTRQPTSPPGANNSDLLNNPTGLILGATALTAITRNPNLISSIGNGIGRFFNNAGDILPVSSNVPAAPAPVNPASVPAPATTPAVGQATDAAAPVADAGTAQEQAQLLAGITENPAAVAREEQAQLLAGITENPAPFGDEALAALEAAQAAQEAADLALAAESATPVDYTTEALLLEQQLTAQAIADEELNARLDRAADVPLTDEDAAILAQEVADLQIAAESASPVDTDPDGLLAQQEAIRQAQDAADLNTALTYEATPVPLSALDPNEFSAPDIAQNQPDSNAGASVARGLTNQAQEQSTLQTRVTQTAAADWRVRLRLAPNATYLYKAKNPGILKPLANTDGVIFPYTPAIDTSYTAKYDSYDLTHSNYRGYFYKNSTVENITIKGTFTAQDTREAEYLLAVIHFFRSVTKMFYGQDPQAGAPPPLVYLSGFGQFQFNEHPCVVSNFSYNLPTDVDYIRATGFNNIGLNLENRRTQSSGPSIGGSLGTVVAIIDRLKNAGLNNGSIGYISDAEQIAQMNKVNAATAQNSVNSTYVPTKMEISISLLPMQTRNQVSKQFSLEGFAQGRLLSGGFW